MLSLRQVLAAGACVLVLGSAAALPGHAAEADKAAMNAALLGRYFADVNAHDTTALVDVIADAYVQHGAGQGQGRAGMQAAFERYFAMFPDFHMALEDSVVTDDKVVARFLVTATHDRPVQLGPNAPLFQPTGKKLAWEGISIWRVADGKFVEHWDVDDLLAAAQQMRAQPASDATPHQ